jgi:hypothetical protein
MANYVPLIENKNRKVNTSDQALLYEFSIINTGKVFHLSWDEMFHFDKEKFITTVKEKYKNNFLFISVDEINKKLKSKGLFDSKRDNWYNLRNHSGFKITINDSINGFKVIEYDENEFNNLSFENLQNWGTKRMRSRSRFGFGDESEGVFFTYDQFFCLLSNGNVKDGHFLMFGNPNNTFVGFEFNKNEISSFFQDIISIGISQYIYWENTTLNRLRSAENDLSELKNNIIIRFDKDGNGLIDVIEDKNEFVKLLANHKNLISEKGKEFNQNYTHQFIKVGNYLKDKKNNLQLIFDCVKNVDNLSDLNEYVDILENEIHSYNLLLFNSLNLLVSLIEDDQLTFYDIYEKFDKLNIYNSNWENEISQKLTQLNSNLKKLMYEIRDMSDKIVNSINELTYVTEESNRSLSNQLSEIDSSIQANNLLSVIQTYQMYKINKNTKSLRE